MFVCKGMLKRKFVTVYNFYNNLREYTKVDRIGVKMSKVTISHYFSPFLNFLPRCEQKI